MRCRTHPPRGAQSCTASRSIPSPPPAARLHRSRPEHPRQGRPSTDEVDVARTRTVSAPRPVTPDTLEADPFVLCRAELRYSAREALHRPPGQARRGNREYQNPWGQSSRHRRLERPNADPERLFDFQTRTVSPFDPSYGRNAHCCTPPAQIRECRLESPDIRVGIERKHQDPVRQANWQKVGGVSPLERRSNRTTFLREPCVGSREGAGEASVAVRMGRANEHRNGTCSGCRGFRIGRRQHRWHRYGERSASPAVSENPCTFARLVSGPWEVFKLPRMS